MKNKTLSRRRFLNLAVAGTATFSGAVWVKTSTGSAARFVRGCIEEVHGPIVAPDFRPDPLQWDSNAVTCSWLGHASVLIDFFGLRLLTDPALYNRVGAHLGLGTIGPKRLVSAALNPRELPPIDLVLLSHAHMDHLDVPTLRRLPGSPKILTAKATGDIISGLRFAPATELAWGEKIQVTTPRGDVHVEAFEVRHWGARWRRDTHRGYNGYILEREGKKILFGGDTAFTSSFADLRSKGPFDFAIMPIGSYQPWINSHCNPEEAVKMAHDAGAKFFLPIHHKTFRLGREPRHEPLERLEAALQAEPERIGWREIGQTFRLV